MHLAFAQFMQCTLFFFRMVLIHLLLLPNNHNHMWWMWNKWIFLADFVTHTQRMYANCIHFILSKRTEYDAVLFTLFYFLFVMLIDEFTFRSMLWSSMAMTFFCDTLFDGFSVWYRLWIQFACRGYVNWQSFWIMHTIEGHEKSTLLNWNDCSRFLQWLIHIAWLRIRLHTYTILGVIWFFF